MNSDGDKIVLLIQVMDEEFLLKSLSILVAIDAARKTPPDKWRLQSFENKQGAQVAHFNLDCSLRAFETGTEEKTFENSMGASFAAFRGADADSPIVDRQSHETFRSR